MRKLALTFFLSFFGLYCLAQENSPPEASTEGMDTELTSDYLEMISGDETTEFYLVGNVTLKGTKINMTSDELRITAAKIGDADATIGKMGNVISILAIGNVKINEEGRSAESGRAELFPEEKRILLTDNPILTENNQTISGEEVEWFAGQRRAQVRGGEQRVVVTIGAVPEFGFDPNAPESEEGEQNSANSEGEQAKPESDNSNNP